MVDTLQARKKEDHWVNRKQGEYGIRAKMFAENLGVNTDKISDFGSTPEADVPLLQNKLAELEQQGFGRQKKVSRWQRHVQQERVKNPTFSFKEVLQHASTTYRK
jgi:hypothetical protein